MRISRVAICLLTLACGFAGCSQTSSFRPARSAGGSDVKTVASVGDQPLPIASAEPGSKARAVDDAPPPPSTVGTRVSGRVFSERGKPVPNAKVRLAVGGASGGKVVSATTDRSGAFTLHGLRAGSSYTVIAEYDDGVATMTGRAQVKAPQTNVRIGLLASGDDSEADRASIRPARPRIEPISNVDPVDDEPARSDVGAGRINFEDMGPPAAEAASVGARQGVQVSRAAGSGRKASGRSSWNARDGAPAKTTGSGDAGAAGDDESAAKSAPAAQGAAGAHADEVDDDGENPLPPALDRATTKGAARAVRSIEEEPVQVASNTPSSRSGRPARTRTRSSDSGGAGGGAFIAEPADQKPRANSSALRPGERLIKPGAYGPITMGERSDDDAGAPVAPRRLPASGSPRPAAGSEAAQEGERGGLADEAPPGDSASTTRRPTWGELADGQPDVPLDESLKRASRKTVSQNAATTEGQITLTSATEDPPKTALSRLFAGARPKRDDAVKQSVCRIDPTERRLVDFQLPGLDGKWVSLRDIDADVILLDFWGSWCAPCRTSTAHLIELQGQLAGKRLQVVGIACEPGATPEERQARAAKAAKELGINYPVLVSTKGGSCPVQQALQVQFYPTLVLLDRDGRILAREQGATDTTLIRIDKAIAQALQIKLAGAAPH
jgi:thiol-disulfide isomerase/thioredoxin